MRRLLDIITRACEWGILLSTRPFRFRPALPPDEIVSSTRLPWISSDEGRPVLHVVDGYTRFQGAAWLRCKSTEDIWTAFLEFWATLYLGYPRIMRVDRRGAIVSEHFLYTDGANWITIQENGLESHNYLGTGKRVEAPLRWAFSILRNLHPLLHPELRWH